MCGRNADFYVMCRVGMIKYDLMLLCSGLRLNIHLFLLLRSDVLCG